MIYLPCFLETDYTAYQYYKFLSELLTGQPGLFWSFTNG